MLEYLFSKIYIHFWLPPLLLSIKLLKIKHFSEYFAEERKYIRMHPDLEKTTNNYGKTFERIPSVEMDKILKKEGPYHLSRGFDVESMKEKYEMIFWFSYILIAILLYVIGYFLTKNLLDTLSFDNQNVKFNIVEISRFGSWGKYFFLPIFSLCLPSPLISFYGTLVAPFLLKRKFISFSHFYCLFMFLPMRFNILRNISIAVGLITFYAYLSFSYKQILFKEDSIVINRLLGEKEYLYRNLEAFRYTLPSKKDEKPDLSKIKKLEFLGMDVSFGELGHDSILKFDNEYYSIDETGTLDFIKRDEISKNILEKFSLISPNIYDVEAYDLFEKKPDYKIKVYTNENYVTHFFLCLMFNLAFLCFFLTFGSKLKVFYFKYIKK